MKALVLEAYNQLTYKSVPDPVISEKEVLIKVKACGICGSDVHGMDGSTGRRIPPIIMGHEATGEIVETGKDVHKWHKGDRITFDSTIYRLDDWYTRKGLYNLSDGRMDSGSLHERLQARRRFCRLRGYSRAYSISNSRECLLHTCSHG